RSPALSHRSLRKTPYRPIDRRGPADLNARAPLAGLSTLYPSPSGWYHEVGDPTLSLLAGRVFARASALPMLAASHGMSYNLGGLRASAEEDHGPRRIVEALPPDAAHPAVRRARGPDEQAGQVQRLRSSLHRPGGRRHRADVGAAAGRYGRHQ